MARKSSIYFQNFKVKQGGPFNDPNLIIIAPLAMEHSKTQIKNICNLKNTENAEEPTFNPKKAKFKIVTTF